MALNSYALTTVDRTKTFMGMSGATNDAVLEILINSCTDFIEKECGGRRFKQTAYTNEEYDGSGSRTLVLRNWSVSETATFTLQYRETLENLDKWATVQAKDYKIDFENGLVHFITKTSIFHREPYNYRVSYTAGYDYDNVATYLSDVGAGDLEMACWMLVRDIFNEKGMTGNIRSESIGNYSVTFARELGLHPEVQTMIQRYQKVAAY